MEIYFDADYITVKYDATHHILIVTWNLPPTSKEFRDGMMVMLDAMKHFKAGRMVSDVVNLGALLEEDQTWAATEWRALAVPAGHSKVAFILSDDVFTTMSMDDMLSKADKDVSSAYFNRMEDAIRWVVIPQQRNSTGTSALKNSTDK
ncbi:MAG TPA: hypothetical protein VL943_07165 [Niabella sp.]|jgi:hypothetical protein|nr:hypothetical protein [Niabella sp.]